MQKSYADINQFLQVANAWLERNPKESKLRYALTKVLKAGVKLIGEYEEQREEINIEHCAVDDKGVILRDEKGQFRFTKDGLKARNKAVNALFRSQVTIEPHYFTGLVTEDELSADEVEYFTGFVLHPIEVPTLELVNGKANHEEATQ